MSILYYLTISYCRWLLVKSLDDKVFRSIIYIQFDNKSFARLVNFNNEQINLLRINLVIRKEGRDK